MLWRWTGRKLEARRLWRSLWVWPSPSSPPSGYCSTSTYCSSSLLQNRYCIIISSSLSPSPSSALLNFHLNPVCDDFRHFFTQRNSSLSLCSFHPFIYLFFYRTNILQVKFFSDFLCLVGIPSLFNISSWTAVFESVCVQTIRLSNAAVRGPSPKKKILLVYRFFTKGRKTFKFVGRKTGSFTNIKGKLTSTLLIKCTMLIYY